METIFRSRSRYGKGTEEVFAGNPCTKRMHLSENLLRPPYLMDDNTRGGFVKRFLHVGSIVAASLALGLGSAWWAVERSSCPHKIGSWEYDPLVGSTAAGAYMRAYTAWNLPLALNPSEAVYLLSKTDGDGNDLDCDGVYRIEGRDIESRWWSITCYDDTGQLIDNPQNRYSYNQDSVARNPDGAYVIRLSRLEQQGNWLPLGSGKRFSVVLRLYNPPPAILNNLDAVALPRIIREK
jgi:hypothetical protein